MKSLAKNLTEAINRLPRPLKRAMLVGFDFVSLGAAVWLSYCLRLNQIYVPSPTQLGLIALAPLVALPVFLRLGLYRSIIRYLPDRAIWTILQATTISVLLWVALLFVGEMSGIEGVPRTVPFLYWAFASAIVVGSRFAAKYMLWVPMRRNYSRQVVIYGAGTAGAQLADALRREGVTYVAGFLDDDLSLQGRDLGGVRVYPPAEMGHLIEKFGVREVILSADAADPIARRDIVAALSTQHVRIRTVPALTELASDRHLVTQLREIDIDDVLGRSSVPADAALLQKMIAGRSILVSGAGGSIGSELCRLISQWNPSRLVLLEANEFALYEVNRRLAKISSVEIVPVLGSVTDEQLVMRTLRTGHVNVVFHAAAHKHVPLVEMNALEGIRNNVIGTRIIAEAALKSGVEAFILISSDKAVRPTNVMGATKRWAELIMLDCADRARAMGTKQQFLAVRFGNVLGSNGSVVPLFKEQIAAGGPVTLTDEAMTRYFMSIHEAAELIVQAGALGEGGDVFLLDMGAPMRIRDLAENMIRLAGLSIHSSTAPEGEIAIVVIGQRPGEKIHEELFYDSRHVRATAQPKILRTTAADQSPRELTGALRMLSVALGAEDEGEARSILFGLIEEGSMIAPNARPDLKIVDGRFS